MEIPRPGSETELVDLVADAAAHKTPLDVCGNATLAGWGRLETPGRRVSLSGLSGIIDYAPTELVLTAWAGTPMVEIEAALAAHRQHLGFEPADLGPLYGKRQGGQTLGGILGANLSGPRRPFAGAARDFFLGFRAVNGRGELFKAGGKVVKNVTGYDLPKLMAGSFGTLAVLSEITIKVVPAPETSATLLAFGLDAEAANAKMTGALASNAGVSGAAFLPETLAARSTIASVRQAGASVTALRLEGLESSVSYRLEALRRLVAGATLDLAEADSRSLWREIRDVAAFLNDPRDAVWRLSVPPDSGGSIARQLSERIPSASVLLDWGGGRIWLAAQPDDKEIAPALAASCRKGGHATLMRGPANLRDRDDVFALEAPLELLLRVRAAFDPLRLFNRGRLHPEL
jgi:glycolate oxidase FAD binding subunit